MASYVSQVKKEKTDAGVLGVLLGAGVVLASGGAMAPAILAGAATGAATADSVREAEVRRFKTLYRAHVGGAQIESLPIRYVTEFIRVGGAAGAHDTLTIASDHGDLAEAVGNSSANPLIFKDVNVAAGQPLDGGVDSLAKIPLNAGCARFPGHQFVVSNVTLAEPVLTAGRSCPSQIVRITPPRADAKKALQGIDPDFSALVWAGYAAARDQLNFSTLPTERSAPLPADVCQHTAYLAQLAGGQPGTRAIVPSDISSCVRAGDDLLRRSPLEYSCVSRCTMAARSFREADACRCDGRGQRTN